MTKYIEFTDLVGKTLANIENVQDQELILTLTDGTKYKFYHEQDCCEHVEIDDVCGDLNDLLNTPLLLAEEATDDGETDWGTYTWTFYKFATIKGDVTVKWYGQSNGYYSESVNFCKM